MIIRTTREHGVPYYWDAEEWKLKSGELLLSFTIYNELSVYCDGIWRVLAVINKGHLVPAEILSRPFGLNFTRQDMTKLARMVRPLIKKGTFSVHGPLVSISEFARLLSQD
jgi:hypothetical protein